MSNASPRFRVAASLVVMALLFILSRNVSSGKVALVVVVLLVAGFGYDFLRITGPNSPYGPKPPNDEGR